MSDPNPERPAPLAIRSLGSGYVVEGPGFYVWDEDEERVRGAARELRAGRLPRAATHRLLVVEPHARGARETREPLR